MHVFVVGYPSAIGGADTELWHVLRLWRRQGLDVTLIPTWRPSPTWRSRCDVLGAKTIEIDGPGDIGQIDGLPGAIVISFCNGKFLTHASRFRELGCRIAWAGCMTWLFAAEHAHYEDHGAFDAYIFQSEYQRRQLAPQLAQYGVSEAQCFLVRGALDVEEFRFAPQPHEAGRGFCVGRLSRPDLDKWHPKTWEIYERIPCRPLRARIMGWNARLAEKLGEPPAWAEVLRPCAEPADRFLRSLHCLVAVNGGAAENWPRVGLEAMACGVPVVAEKKWGWPEMVIDGRTGFLAEDEDGVAQCVGRLGGDEKLRWRMIRAAYQDLTDRLACPCRIWAQWSQVFDCLESRG